MSLIFIDKVKINQTAFANRVYQICSLLGIDPNWLMIVMYSESGLNHKAYNTTGGATGLIQFMPATAINLGTSTQNLLKMSNVDQLDYVYKYYKPKAGQFKSGEDLYLYNFFPAAVGKSDDFVFQTKKLKASTIAIQNPVFDIDKNLVITVGEFKKALRKTLAKKINDQRIFDLFFEKKNSL